MSDEKQYSRRAGFHGRPQRRERSQRLAAGREGNRMIVLPPPIRPENQTLPLEGGFSSRVHYIVGIVVIVAFSVAGCIALALFIG